MGQIRNINALGLVLVAGRNDLYDFVAGETEFWDRHGVASHKIAIKNAEDGFVSDNKEIVLFSFKFKNNWFKTNGEIVVRLWN